MSRSVNDGRSRGATRAPVRGAFLASVALAALLLGAPILGGGAWDPYEIDSADLARRIAVHVFDASSLARQADPPMPTLSDLGMGELPFTAMALSFRLFGVNELSGRLPMLLFGVVGAASLALLLARTVSGRAAFAATVCLVTTPLYFLHARSMIGDIATMAGFSMAIAGLGLWMVDESPRAKAMGGGLAALGLVVGVMTRGLLVGAAAPLFAAALAGFAGARLFDARGPRRWMLASSALFATTATIALVVFVRLANTRIADESEVVSRWVGMTLADPSPTDSTFDRLIRELGHSLYPWSALVPAAFAVVLSPLRATTKSEPSASSATAASSFARLLVLSAAISSFLTASWLTPMAGPLPWFGVASLAGVIGIAAADLDLRAPVSKLRAIATAFLLVVLHVDLTRDTSRILSGFGFVETVFAKPFDAKATTLIRLATLLALGFFCFPWIDRGVTQPEPHQPKGGSVPRRALRGLVEEGRVVGRAILTAWSGNLVFVLVLVEALLVGIAAMLFIGTRARWEAVISWPSAVVGALIDAWWAVPLGLLMGVVAFGCARMIFEQVRSVVRIGRGSFSVAGGAIGGLVLSFALYPAAARELSPRSAFDAFGHLRRPGDELAIVGTSARAGAFFTGSDVPAFDDTQGAIGWLESSEDQRRFLMLRARDLPRANSLWRRGHSGNLPIVDARSSQTLLASDRLDGALDANPLRDIVLPSSPPLDHPVEAVFADSIELVGWELLDADGRRVKPNVAPSRKYTLRTYYRCKRPSSGGWSIFLHVDGQGKRYSGDHAVTAGRYPLALWQPGDVIVDDADLELPASFGPGEYWIMGGFFQGETRMHVSDGPNQDDRVILGHIVVR